MILQASKISLVYLPRKKPQQFISIKTPGREYFLYADNKEEHQAWMNAFSDMGLPVDLPRCTDGPGTSSLVNFVGINAGEEGLVRGRKHGGGGGGGGSEGGERDVSNAASSPPDHLTDDDDDNDEPEDASSVESIRQAKESIMQAKETEGFRNAQDVNSSSVSEAMSGTKRTQTHCNLQTARLV